MGNRQEIVTLGEGLYVYEMSQNNEGDYFYRGQIYRGSWIVKPGHPNEEKIRNMVKRCKDKITRYYGKNKSFPKRVRVSALEGIDGIGICVDKI